LVSKELARGNNWGNPPGPYGPRLEVLLEMASGVDPFSLSSIPISFSLRKKGFSVKI